MNIAFRVDASKEIGTGHLMRCLALANSMLKYGARVRFVSRFMPEHLSEMIIDGGHEFIRFENKSSNTDPSGLAHAQWLGTSQEQDAKDCIAALSEVDWNWLAVDHYALDSRWESEMRKVAENILAIDDLADRKHDCDVLLDQNYYSDMSERYDCLAPEKCQFLLGPRYALLRDEFKYWRDNPVSKNSSVKRLLVMFGGVDKDDFTSQVIKSLINCNREELCTDVIIGKEHPNQENIQKTCSEHGLDCYVEPKNIAELMAAADLSIGAGGTVTWERFCLGIPALVISAADNQTKQITDLSDEGFIYSPDFSGNLVKSIETHINSLLGNSRLLKMMSRKGMKIVDGRGTLRVAGKLGCSDIEISRATQNDSENILKWRNHPAVRKVSRNKEIIKIEDHNSWFSSMLSDTHKVLLIGYRNGCPVGVVRFDFSEGEEAAEISIYLVPDINETGLGSQLLAASEYWAKKNYVNLNEIKAEVIEDNTKSHRLFINSDYKVEETHYSKRF